MSKLSVFVKTLICIAVTVLFFVSGVIVFAVSNEDSNKGRISNLEELNGKKIGIASGMSYDTAVKKRLTKSQIVYFQTFADGIESLKKGRLDAYVVDKPLAEYQKAENPSLYYIDEDITKDDYAFMMNKSSTELCAQVNNILDEMWADGTIEELQNKWMKLADGDPTVEKNPDADTSKGTLKVITTPDQAPFTFYNDGEIVGYDAEVITKIAEKLGYAVEFTIADSSAELPSVISGKYDMAIGCITITEERAESVLFSNPDYHGGTVAVLYGTSGERETIIGGIEKSFGKTFVTENRWKLVVNGLEATTVIVLASMFIGSILGFFFSFMLRSGKKLVSHLGRFLSGLFDSIPILIILMIFYYVIFSETPIPPIVIGVFAFSLNFANIVAGLLNSGISEVDKGEIEAAAALGYSKRQIFMKIIFPQAARKVSGQFNGAVISLIKGTSVVGYITVVDLTKAGDFIRSRTYEAFFPLVVVAVIYFLLEYIIIAIIKKFEIKLEPKRRARKVKGVDVND